MLLTDDLKVKIADFGLAAQLREPGEQHYTLCGTPNYISPEVAVRAAHSLETDLWSLGCVFYTLLVGKPPFDTEGAHPTLKKVVIGEYELPSHVSENAQNLIQSLLQRKPSERLKLEQILDHPFFTEDNHLQRTNEDSAYCTLDDTANTPTTTAFLKNTPINKLDTENHPISKLNIDDQPIILHKPDFPLNAQRKIIFSQNDEKEMTEGVRQEKINDLLVSQAGREASSAKLTGAAEILDSRVCGGDERTAPESVSKHTADMVAETANCAQTQVGSPPLAKKMQMKRVQHFLACFQPQPLTAYNYESDSSSILSDDSELSDSSYLSSTNAIICSQQGFTSDTQTTLQTGVEGMSVNIGEPGMTSTPIVERPSKSDLTEATQPAALAEFKLNERADCPLDRSPEAADRHTLPFFFADTLQALQARCKLFLEKCNTSCSPAKQRRTDCGVKPDDNMATQGVLQYPMPLQVGHFQGPMFTGRGRMLSPMSQNKGRSPGVVTSPVLHSKGSSLNAVLSPISQKMVLSPVLRPSQGASVSPQSQGLQTAVLSPISENQIIATAATMCSPCHSSSSSRQSKDSTGNGLQPLTSERLRPIRQKTRNAIVNILENGEVHLEFLKSRSPTSSVMEVLNISPDGTQVTVFRPPKDSGVTGDLLETPTSIPPTANTYTNHTLPKKYWKKYLYASRFIRMVKSKTPKVTYFSDQAKCMLMESAEDFEAIFYSGPKFSISSHHVKVIDPTGMNISFEMQSESTLLSAEVQTMWQHVQMCRDHCQSLEKLLSSAEMSISDSSHFPVIIGSRWSAGVTQSTNDSFAASPPRMLTCDIQPPTMCSFDGSLISSATTMNHPTSFSPDRRPMILPPYQRRASITTSDESSQIVMRKYVNGVGWASQLRNGSVCVQFDDGNQLTVYSHKSEVTFVFRSGLICNYNENDVLPEVVRRKLEILVHIVSMLSL
ncbi:PLK4 [Bugula neritina]|uniref:PLK4 n=1 Tax=Bugula neritina TaxID=10212 RepID=A0A7J7KRV6_BUGNE|nr:PLK4 [Bugula neritina]